MTAQLSTLVAENYRNIDPTRLTSVVILSCNRKSMMEKSITSLRQRTDLPYEVIILDNGSHDQETLDYLKSIDGTSRDGNGKVKVIYNPTNEGCSVGRNLAVQQAKGDYIVTMDNDMIYTNNWLEELIDKAESNKRIGAVSSQIVFPDHTIQWNGGYIERKQGNLADFTPVDYHKEENCETLSGDMLCDWLPGGATLVKREVLDKGIEHDKDYINGYEDYDYSLKIKKAGFLLANCPKSKVIHYHRKYDPDFGNGKDKTYANNRNSHDTLFESLKVFYQRTGYDLMEEIEGTKPFKRAFGNKKGIGIDKKLQVLFALTDRPVNDLGIRRRKHTESINRRRQQIQRQYQLSSMDVNSINPDLIRNILAPYTRKIKENNGNWDLDGLSRAIAEILQKERAQFNGKAGFFEKTGVVSYDGVEEIITQTKKHLRGPDNWWPDHILRSALRFELKYFGVDPAPPQRKPKEKRKNPGKSKGTGHSLVKKIKETYALGEDTKLMEFYESEGSLKNKLWLVKSGGNNYMLKRYYSENPGSKTPDSRVIREHKIMEHIDAENFTRFAKPFKAKNTAVKGVTVDQRLPTLITIGKYTYALFEYLDGERPETGREAINDCKRVASTLAHFHNAVKDFAPPGKDKRTSKIKRYKASKHVKDYKDKLAGASGSNPDVAREKQLFGNIDSFVDSLERKLEHTSLPRLMCHDDLYADNLIMAGKDAHIIDLEGAVMDYRLADFTLAMYHFACRSHGLDHNKVEAFASVYQDRYKLTDEEIELVPDFLKLIVPHVMMREARKAKGAFISETGERQRDVVEYCDKYFKYVDKKRDRIINRLRKARARAA